MAQQNVSDIEKLVDQQVWQVFKTSYEARDSEVFKSIHLKDVLRVYDGNIRLGYEHHQSISSWRPLRADRSIRIDFAFESRQYKDTVGYEVGYYRVINERTGMASDTSYGRFHVILKMYDGLWKIAQDYDTGSVGDIKIDRSFFDAAEFLKLK